MAKRKGKGTAGKLAEAFEVTSAISEEEAIHAGKTLGEISFLEPGTPIGKVVIQVAPEDVLLDPRLQGLREWSGESVQEMAIPELARLMLEEGQEHPAKCRTTKDGDLLLYSGHRRREAILYAREQGWKVYLPSDPNSEPSGEPMLDVVVEEKDDAGALRAAMAENVQRADFTEIELMRAIKLIRETFHSDGDVWLGPAGTANVAGFLGVSPATVTQAEKLGRLSPQMQADVQAGRISPFAAREWLDTAGGVADPEKKKEVQAQVLDEAQRIADEREARAARKREEAEAKRVKTVEKRAGKGGKKGVGEAEGDGDGEDAAPEPVKAQKAPKAPAKGKLTGKDVRQAAQKVPGAAPAKTKAPRMSELTDLADTWTSEAAFPPVMCKFAAALSAWGHGKKTLNFLKAAWDDVADHVDRPKGKAPAVAEGKAKVQKKSVGKKAAKPAAGKTSKGGKSGKAKAKK